jgi:hypothetical protein
MLYIQTKFRVPTWLIQKPQRFLSYGIESVLCAKRENEENPNQDFRNRDSYANHAFSAMLHIGADFEETENHE